MAVEEKPEDQPQAPLQVGHPRKTARAIPWLMSGIGFLIALSALSVPEYWETLLGIGLILLLTGVLWVVPELQLRYFGKDAGSKDAPALTNDFRRTLAQILGGIVLLLGLVFTWHQVRSTEKQVIVAQEGQITERFTRAIEHLGSQNLEMRLGGIYALERIARDSQRDHWPIMEILTTFVREHASWEEADTSFSADEGEAPEPRADIQAILTVVGRRNVEHELEGSPRLDLRRTDLRRVSLKEGHFQKALFFGACLDSSYLFKTCLDSAHLASVGLCQATLSRASLQGAYLLAAHLEKAMLSEAHLEGAYLFRARLDSANLVEARLDSANLSNAYLQGARLRDAHLSGANLMGTDLCGVDLRKVHGLTERQIQAALTDRATLLPDYFQKRATPTGTDD